MTTFLQQIVNSLSLGSIYVLVALGYTMVYGIIHLINFAHGDIYMVGAYLGWLCIVRFNLGFLPSLLITMIGTMTLGMIIEKVAYKPLRNATRVAALITAIAVSFLLEYVVMYFAGPDFKTFRAVLPSISYKIGGVIITFQQIMIFVISIVLMIALQLFVTKTKTGCAMRAVSADTEAARLMGINVDRTISITFALGSALAGAAGIMVGIYYNTINPLMGSVPGTKAFIAAVFGGIGSIPGAMIGGFVIAFIETMVGGYVSTLIQDAVVYALLIVILIFKPRGLMGINKREKV
jgi:branched-chain amino acid transport system permease protein